MLGLCAVFAAPGDSVRNRKPVDARRASEADDAMVNRAADRIGKDRATFREQAARDHDLRIAVPSSRPFYACQPPRVAEKKAARAAGRSSAPVRLPSGQVAPSGVGTDTSVYINDTPFPLDQTFALHTRPGATRILYLDFKGFRVHATDWNDSNYASDDIVIAPFDVDGDDTTFSNAELGAIQEVWRRVAEDFAPFDVDVTTEDPGEANLVYDGPGDDHWGQRMVCGGWASDVLGSGSGGTIGVAYMDTFQSGQSYDSNGNLGTDTPAFTFTRDIIDYEPVNYAAEIASTASHEFGHTLGLSHDGDRRQEYYPGYAGWAPIMGSGDPDVVVQWSKGEYAYANNKEDDLAIIANYLPYVTLDHATSAGSAVALASGDTAGGVILSADDTAWYKISAAPGAVTFTGSVATPSQPNLKLKLSLMDAAGNVVATSPAGSQMSAALSATLTARGTYYLVVDGVGYLTPSTGFSDYDSIGRFSLTGAWQAQSSPNVPPSASASASPASGGQAPATIAFSSAGSFDSDGMIVGYEWDFGDGTPVSKAANPSHAFVSPGDYNVRLTVTDSDGATSGATVPVSIAPPPPGAKLISVASLEAAWGRSKGPKVEGSCVVVVRDASGQPLRNALVDLALSGLFNGVRTIKTDRQGRAVLKLAAIPSTSSGSVLFTVTGVRLTGYYYYPANNQATSVSISR